MAAATPKTPMCDDSETVAMFSENEGDEIGLAPTLNNFYEECPVASSTVSASVKATDSAQTVPIPDRTEDMYGRILSKLGWYITVISNVLPPPHSYPDSSIISRRLLSARRPELLIDSRVKSFCNFVILFHLLRDAYLLGHQSSTQNIDKDSYIQVTKDAFTALGQDTTWIDEIEKLSEEDFPPARIQKLEDELKRGKGAAVKFKQIGFTHVMTIMEGLVSEMTELKADIAMQAESSKGPLFPYSCIPDKIPHFIGRQKECQVILNHLTARDTRLVDVWGPPGFGKTSVAINVAHHLRAMEIPVYLISLRGMKSKNELLSKLFSQFAVTYPKSHHMSATDWLIHCLQQLQNHHVLILDNADDLLESGDATLKEEVLRCTEEILTQCSHIKLLFTTREPLDYLSHKIPIHNERVGVLDEVSSVNLVQSLWPNVSGDDCSSIVKVCGQVPLAMRLMCGILKEKTASLSELLQELKSLPLVEVLDNASFSDGARFKKIIDNSFQRLTDQEKRAFVSLAVFPGCFGIADATTVLHLKTDRTTKNILRTLERKSLIESYFEDSVTAFRVHPLLRGFVDVKQRTDPRFRVSFCFAKLRFYFLEIKRFAKAFIKFLTGRLVGSFSSLFNDNLYRRVVEVLSKPKLFLYAVWHNSLYGRCTDTADCPFKLQCYHGIHQILSGDMDKGISSLSSCVDCLSSRGDQKFLKVLGYGALAHAYQRKGQEELASHFQFLCSSEAKGTSWNVGLCTAPKIFNNCHDLSSPMEDASGHGQSCRQQECLHFRSDSDLCSIPQASILHKSPDTVQTRVQVKKFASCSTLPNKKKSTHEGEGRPLPMLKAHEEETAEEQAFAVPFADQDSLRSQLYDLQDVVVHLQEYLQLEQASLENPEPDTRDLETSEGLAFTLPSSVQVALRSKSCDAQEVVNRLQEELRKGQSSLEHPDAETKKMIRCLAREAKCLRKLDVVERLRDVTPAGTTGPLLHENLDVLDIPFEQIRELSVNLCGGDEWKMVAEKLGLSPAEIRLLDKRCFKPFKKALKYSRRQKDWKVGQLYDVLVDCGFPIFADFL